MNTEEDKSSNIISERHPLPPFYPDKAEWLFLGSFPPKQHRWSMNFYYPNFQNDMWRIFGLIFFRDKNHFVDAANKSFRKELLIEFLISSHIAIYDMAEEVIRHKDNASDKDLEIVKPLDIISVIHRLPDLRNIVATGQKSTETLIQQLHLTVDININVPKLGDYVLFSIQNRTFRIYRMPSSSRAYPLSLEKKAIMYAKVFGIEY
jgi:G:T/U-mismatch repair DNA glycosylase